MLEHPVGYKVASKNEVASKRRTDKLLRAPMGVCRCIHCSMVWGLVGGVTDEAGLAGNDSVEEVKG